MKALLIQLLFYSSNIVWSVMAPHSTAPAADRTNVVPDKAPPLIIVDDVLRARALDEDQRPLLSFPKSRENTTDYDHYCGRDLDRFVDHATKYYVGKGLEPVSQTH